MPVARSISPARISFILLCLFFAVLWLAGGASRADVLGQAVVRSAAWLTLIGAICFGQVPRLRDHKFPLVLMIGILAVCLAQLVPLPPAIWQGLPGRSTFTDVALGGPGDQPWRPLAIVPSAAFNSASSLVVPMVTLVLVAGLNEDDWKRLPCVIIVMVSASALIGLMQFSGVGYDGPLINDIPGYISGVFANRNHFALFLALGCLILPIWGVTGNRSDARGWRIIVSFGLTLLLLLLILATGSRAGMLVGAVALGASAMLGQHAMKRVLSRFPPWAAMLATAAIVALIVGLIVISVISGRAESVSRALAISQEEDIRSQALPTIFAIIASYFPFGAGFGGFDQIFRIHEPMDLLRPVYFNHAHNDVLELIIDAGIFGVALLVAAIGWWAVVSVQAWKSWRSAREIWPAVGSMALVLVGIASMFDYPIRTPIVMAMTVVAAAMLGRASVRNPSALPQDGNHI